MNGIRSNSRIPAGPSTVLAAGYLIALAVVAVLRPQAMPLLFVGTVMTAASARAAQWLINGRVSDRAKAQQRLLLIGAGSAAQHLAEEAERCDWQVVGFLEDAGVPTADGVTTGLLGPRAALAHVAREFDVDRVIITDSPATAWPYLKELEADENPCAVYVVPGPYELALSAPSMSRIGDVALLPIRGRASAAAQLGKRVVDVATSLLLLLLLGPVLLLAMLAIRCGGGPALFWQERVGRGGRRFRIVKLRTMVPDAEKDGPRLCSGKSDPRLTPVGRFLRRTHLDEVPQLWNVLRGEMSLVGPRPERPCFVEQFEEELPEYGERHRILPGITGLAQVCGDYHSSPREKLRFDLMYLYHQSLWLDLRIIVRTALSLLG